MYYFGYGSNINDKEMNCTDYEYLGIGKLHGYELAFTRYSSKRRGGVLDIISKAEGHVIGALYAIKDECLEFLDLKEGVSWNYYQRKIVEIELNSTIVENVLTYEVVEKDFTQQPEQIYSYIVLEGMEYKKFPKYYIENFKNLANIS